MNNKILSLFCILLIFLFSVVFVSAGNVIVQDEFNTSNDFKYLDIFLKSRNLYKIQIIKNMDMLPGDSLESPDESFFLGGRL